MDKAMSNLAFWGMSVMFSVRDKFNPPEDFIAEMDLRPGDVVLDYGCGPGSFMAPVIKAVGSSGAYYGLDLHPKALKRVQTLARQSGYPNVKTIHSDCETGLPADSVDAVVLYDIFHMFSDPAAILAELHRVLKPGGLLSVTDPHISAAAVIQGVTHTGLFSFIKRGKTFNFTATACV